MTKIIKKKKHDGIPRTPFLGPLGAKLQPEFPWKAETYPSQQTLQELFGSTSSPRKGFIGIILNLYEFLGLLPGRLLGTARDD